MNITLGPFIWSSYGIWAGEYNEQSDGQLIDTLSGQKKQLDIWTVGEIKFDHSINPIQSIDIENVADEAKRAWDDGRVLYMDSEETFGVPVLILPHDKFDALILKEALLRFMV